jgi:hypothetical protein
MSIRIHEHFTTKYQGNELPYRRKCFHGAARKNQKAIENQGQLVMSLVQKVQISWERGHPAR